MSVFRYVLHRKLGGRQCPSIALHDYSHENQSQLRSRHGELDYATEVTESEEEESDLEQQCDTAKGKSRKVSCWLEYEVQETWAT